MVTARKNKKLYIFSTKSYLKEGWIKVGESNSPKDRTKGGGQTFNKEKLLPLIDPITLPLNITDYNIRDYLYQHGAKRNTKGGGKEWVKASKEDVLRAINYFIKGIPRANSYSLRDEQQAAVDKAYLWLSKSNSKKETVPDHHRNRFLLNAKMRFGKCFTTIHIAKKLNAKKTLVVTYKPEVLIEWLDSVNDHLDFKDWVGISCRKTTNPNVKFIDEKGKMPKTEESHQVYCVSLQDLKIDEEGKTKKRLSSLIKQEWDLIVFDEVHYGGITSRARHILDSLKYTKGKRIDLSGTPFRLLQMENFCEDQVFTYSYLDEQKKKQDEIKNKGTENIYRRFPDLNFSTIDITKDDIKEELLTFQDNEFVFSLNKLFEASKCKKTNKYLFKHKTAVENFVEGLRKKSKAATSISVYGSLSTTLNLPKDKRHSIWWVDSVNSAKAMVSLLSRHEYFKQFAIVDASGCGTKEILEEMPDVTLARAKVHVLSAIASSESDKSSLGTITITVKRFLVGVTIEEWDSILVLNDVESPEEYYQAIFRIQSPWIDKLTNEINKHTAWVFDFSLNRCLTLKINLAATIAAEKTRKNKLEKADTKDHLPVTVSELIESLSLKSYVDGRLIPNAVTPEDVFNIMTIGAARASLARKITSDYLVSKIPSEILEKNSKLENILNKIKGYKTQDVSKNAVQNLVQIGPLDEDLGGSKKSKGKEGSKKKTTLTEDQKRIQKKARFVIGQIKRLSICLSDFIYMTKKRENCLDDVVSTTEAKFFKSVTGISKKEFNIICDVGLLRKDKIEENILDFYFQETASLMSEEFIFKSIKKKR